MGDAQGVISAPGWVLAQPTGAWPAWRVLAVGAPGEVRNHPACDGAIPVNLGDAVIVPGLVNAHTHLDLTCTGPLPFDHVKGFIGWIDSVRRSRLPLGPTDVIASTQDGVRRSLAGGVVAIGDIAGNARREPVDVLNASVLHGVSFLEYFGLGTRQPRTIEAMRKDVEWIRDRAANGRLRVGIQPHATYTAGLDVYREATRLHKEFGVPIASHVAEAMGERQFITRAKGPMRTFVESLGLWEHAILSDIGHAHTVLEYIAEALGGVPWLLAHVNDCDDDGIEVLRRCGASVAFCARCHEYFGHTPAIGKHRYRDMLSAGVNVALGTDSVINLPIEQCDRITPMDDARLLYEQDGTDAITLMRMMTINGARSLGLDESAFVFPRSVSGGATTMAGLVAVNVADTPSSRSALDRVMLSRSVPRLLEVGG